ncbi:MAG: transposase [Bacteroidetes bacterium]|nr:transposase [Bacteroidota bacterium]
MKKTFKYRIYTNIGTTQKVEKWLSLCRQLYNNSLEEKIIAYKERKESIFAYQQMKRLPYLKKAFPEYKQVGSQVLQDVIQRLDKAYQSFFRRVKTGEKAGFPRFKGVNRYNSFTLKQTGWRLEGKYLIIKNIGKFKIKLSRPIEGTIKIITISKSSSDKLFVSFSCEGISDNPLPKTNKSIGVDVGCESFLTDSNGNKIDNPRFYKRSETILKRRQQSLSQKVKGSNRRNKARILVAKAHEKVFNQRRDFHFKIANQLLQVYDVIFIEKMKAWNSFRPLNRSMRDVAWFQFFSILKVKAVYAGREIVEVPAKMTSQICSSCGNNVPKDLSVRVHNCSCGLSIDRDFNSALNILRAGQALWYQPRISRL